MFSFLLGLVLVIGLLTRFLSGMLFLPLLSTIFLRIAWAKELRRSRRGRMIVITILIIACVLNTLMLSTVGQQWPGWHYPLTIGIGLLMAAALSPLIFVK